MEDTILNSSLYQEGGGLSVTAPPINNACLPTIYDKLDSDARSKVKVINRMLEKQLVVQEKLIYRYRDDALRMLQHKRTIVEKDLGTILRKYPNMDEMPFLSCKLSVTKKKENRLGQFKAYSTEAIGMKGLSENKGDDPFCDRYYGHHLEGCGRRNRLPVPRRLAPLPTTNNKMHISRPLILSKKLSMSDNILHNKLRLFYNHVPQDDDAMTV